MPPDAMRRSMALFLSDPDREEYSDDEMDEMLQGDDGDDEDMAQVMASVRTPQI